MHGEKLPWASLWGRSSLLLPVAFPAQTQPLLQGHCGKRPTLSSGPSSTLVPRGPAPPEATGALSRHLHSLTPN